jgi:hypothetical protein
MPTTALWAGGRWSPGLGWGWPFWAARRTSPAAARRICPGAAWLASDRPGPSRCWMLPTRPGWILLMRKKFERSEQALGAIPIPGAKFKPRGLCGA